MAFDTIFLISSALAIPTSARRVTNLSYLRGRIMRIAVNAGPIQTNINVAPAQPNQLSDQFLKAHTTLEATSSSHFEMGPTSSVPSSIMAQAHKKECKLEPSVNSKYGENSFWTLESKNWTPVDVVGTWADEFRDYNQNTKVCFSESICGYSTQLLWKNTQRLGCGSVECSDKKGSLFVCFYDPKAQN